MIEWVCDSCGQRVEHEDVNPPIGWSTVTARVTQRAEEGRGNTEWETDRVLLCNRGCGTGSGNALEAKALKILRAGFDSKPRPTNS